MFDLPRYFCRNLPKLAWAAWLLAAGLPRPILAQPVLSPIKVSNPLIHANVGERDTVTKTNYHGWPEAWLISNGVVEAVVVPAISRVMQFRFLNEEGPFWENPDLMGQTPDPTAKEWRNFGGDKTWPAPQADWPKLTRRAWPPPATFDAAPVEVTATARSILLQSPVDAALGLRTQRLIELDPRLPIMIITTTFSKVQGEPIKVGVWVITQLKDPAGLYIPIPKNTCYPLGYNRQAELAPPSLKREKDLISLARDLQSAYKIGSDAGSLLWCGEKVALRIESPRVSGCEYPDQGSSVEVYTNPNPAEYVELETLGPLETLKKGQSISRRNVYTLFHCEGADAHKEAERILFR